jgi:hypothetical protein
MSKAERLALGLTRRKLKSRAFKKRKVEKERLKKDVTAAERRLESTGTVEPVALGEQVAAPLEFNLKRKHWDRDQAPDPAPTAKMVRRGDPRMAKIFAQQVAAVKASSEQGRRRGTTTKTKQTTTTMKQTTMTTTTTRRSEDKAREENHQHNKMGTRTTMTASMPPSSLSSEGLAALRWETIEAYRARKIARLAKRGQDVGHLQVGRANRASLQHLVHQQHGHG